MTNEGLPLKRTIEDLIMVDETEDDSVSLSSLSDQN